MVSCRDDTAEILIVGKTWEFYTQLNLYTLLSHTQEILRINSGFSFNRYNRQSRVASHIRYLSLVLQ